jgi:hypothetical protein
MRFCGGAAIVAVIAVLAVGLTASRPAFPETRSGGGQAVQVSFQSAWPRGVERTWVGPEYWANRLQDWRVRDGRLECLTAASDRNVHILTRRIGTRPGGFSTSVRTAIAAANRGAKERNWVGFRIGARGDFDDYRDSAIYGKGLNAGLSAEGDLFIGDYELLQKDPVRKVLREALGSGVELRFEARPDGERAVLVLTALDPASAAVLGIVEQADFDPTILSGNLALVSHLPEMERPEDGAASWFDGWAIGGERIEAHDDRAFGPILFAQYTLGRGILKMTAQMPPVGIADGQTVRLQIRKIDGIWMDAGDAPIDPDARTATFRIPGWDGTRDVPYRLVYELASGGSVKTPYFYAGTIRREPQDKSEFVLAAFTGNNDVGFPHTEILEHVKAQNPDLLFFSGDQIYERVAGYGVQVEPVEAAILDYLRKWYLFGWAFGDILRDRPSVAIPDDHDVYHGNVWGAGGKAAGPGFGMEAQDAGGYKMPARWVNMIQRTQTSHLPDPADPTPVAQGIGVYFCGLDYAGLSFAVLEDRKFKSAPKPLLPQALVRNGWARNPDWKPDKDSDVKGAELLGGRQVGFLKRWGADWKGGTWMKVVLSQTVFADVFTLPAGTSGDDGVPQLPILAPGEYPPDDAPVADMDSNGWPSSGRNAAIREMRKAFALHVAGDQHLGSTIQYGIDAWRDGGYALCVPSISNIWPRRWFPKNQGLNRKPGWPPYAGDFRDGFGNRMSVAAVANPFQTGRRPAEVYDRATGYGIVRFNRVTREIILECWPRWEDPKAAGAKPYPGWPVRISQFDNYGRAAKAYLPTLKFKGMINPVVQVVDEKTGEIVYTVRSKGDSFRPKVFAPGAYMIRTGEPGTEKWKILRRVQSLPAGSPGQKIVQF